MGLDRPPSRSPIGDQWTERDAISKSHRGTTRTHSPLRGQCRGCSGCCPLRTGFPFHPPRENRAADTCCRHRSENGCIPLSLSAVAVGKLVIGLGIGQVISWGSLIYSIAVLGGPMGVDLEASSTVVFGAFSFSLVVSGAVGPYVGRLIDRIGGRPILAWGSFGAAASLLALSFASSIGAFFLAWALAGIARAMTLYEAAFATLSQNTGTSFRNSVSGLTLLGGL